MNNKLSTAKRFFELISVVPDNKYIEDIQFSDDLFDLCLELREYIKKEVQKTKKEPIYSKKAEKIVEAIKKEVLLENPSSNNETNLNTIFNEFVEFMKNNKELDI